LVFETLISHLVYHITSHTLGRADNKKIDVIVGLDARGFLLGPIIALRLGAAFVPVRKAGKLPGECAKATYEKEYGTVSLPAHLCLEHLLSKARMYLRCRKMLSNLTRA